MVIKVVYRLKYLLRALSNVITLSHASSKQRQTTGRQPRYKSADLW